MAVLRAGDQTISNGTLFDHGGVLIQLRSDLGRDEQALAWSRERLIEIALN